MTVAMPFYNHGQYLSQALEPILALRDFYGELIVCDDASTDGSEKILYEYAEKYPFLKIVKNEQNRGVMATLARLVKETSSEYVILPAADDVWLVEPMQKLLMKITEKPGLDMYSADGFVYYEQEKRKAIRPPSGIQSGVYHGNTVNLFRGSLPWAPSGCIVRTALLQELWDEVSPAGSYHDGLFQLIIAQYHDFYFLEEQASVFRLSTSQFSHADSLFTANWKEYPYILNLLKKKYPELYSSMVKADMFRIFDCLGWYLLFHPGDWDSYTCRILFSLASGRIWTQIRHNLLPALLPEKLKLKYRSWRDHKNKGSYHA
ncbi:MAG: glycosyltransferase [Lentisphaeria bacterium]|nr:glycosyltransferase [Lentisphaeria bacterium]